MSDNVGRNKNGSFSKGHKFWKMNPDKVPKGIAPKFATWQKLKEAMIEYLEWSDENPRYKNDVVKGGDSVGMQLQTPAERPLTIMAFCAFVGYSTSWYRSMRIIKKDDAQWMEVLAWFENVCSVQRLELALLGQIKEGLSSRISTYAVNGIEKLDSKESIEITEDKPEKQKRTFTIKIVKSTEPNE